MPRYCFDIETNGLLNQMTTIHSLVLTNVDTFDTFSYAGHTNTIEHGLKRLEEAEQIIGHNVIAFDIPAIQKIYPAFQPAEEAVFDTLIMSRLLWPTLMDIDQKAIAKGTLPPKHRGRHGLEAWGYRLGEWKGDYSDTKKAELRELHKDWLDVPTKEEYAEYVWGTWNPEMQEYCEQDVRATLALLELIDSKQTDPRAVELEHQVAFIVAEQQRFGFVFDHAAALDLLKELQEARAEAETGLQNLFEPWYSFEGLKTPKRTINYKDLSRPSLTAGAPYSAIKQNVFNPGSRAHIADRLMKVRGWKPTEFTPNGQPKVDETILSGLPYPEAQQMSRFFMLQKRLGQLNDGRNSWLNMYNPETGRIHGEVNTLGTVTGRMSHSNPNVAQTPTCLAPYGERCRALWTVPANRKLVGVDVSGLELRMLAHFMNDPEYTKEVVDGDVHTANMKAAGLANRTQAKTFIYAFLYGAGDGKIGRIIGKGATQGGKLKRSFLDKTPTLNRLIKSVSVKAKQLGSLRGLDGRRLHIRHQHAALNTLLQSAGALVCKRWAVELDRELIARGHRPEQRFNPWADRVENWKATVVANIHDEHQYECHLVLAKELGELSIKCIERAGEYFNLRVPLTGEASIGNNWKETH